VFLSKVQILSDPEPDCRSRWIEMSRIYWW